MLFSFSGLMGLTSLIFLRRIPDATVPEQMRTSQEPVPWLHMLRHQPFRKLLWFILAWAVVMGGFGAFSGMVRVQNATSPVKMIVGRRIVLLMGEPFLTDS